MSASIRAFTLLVPLVTGCLVVHEDPGATVACTLGTGTTKTCFEITASNGTAASADAARKDCTSGGGIASDACSHVGADGGCKMTMNLGGVVETTTYWYYTGSAADEMAGCIKGGNIWIVP